MLYFFYGTLCDPDIRHLILGYRPSPRQLRPARLNGFHRKQAQGHSYPVLIRAPGGTVDGILFRAIRSEDMARLATYEGPDYLTRRLAVRPRGAKGTCRALVFLPRGRTLKASRADWRLRRWQRHQKTEFLSSLRNQGPMPCASR